MEENKISFEEALTMLEDCVKKLESGQIKLEEAFKVFEDGLKYAHICEERLTKIETKVAKILKDGQEQDLDIEQ